MKKNGPIYINEDVEQKQLNVKYFTLSEQGNETLFKRNKKLY